MKPPEDPFLALELIHQDLTVGEALSLMKTMGCANAVKYAPKEST